MGGFDCDLSELVMVDEGACSWHYFLVGSDTTPNLNWNKINWEKNIAFLFWYHLSVFQINTLSSCTPTFNVQIVVVWIERK